MSKSNITCQMSKQKRWGRIFSVMVFGLFLFLSFNVYGENPNEIEIDKEGKKALFKVLVSTNLTIHSLLKGEKNEKSNF